MGIPIRSLVVDNNENDVATSYYQTGVYKKKKTVVTLSTAMDIGAPNNFERVLELFHYDYNEFKKVITAMKVTDEETVETIKKVYAEQQYLMDFHTAVGFAAAEKTAKAGMKTIVISTASPLKFAKEMKETTGIVVDNSHMLKTLRRKKKRVITAANDYNAIKEMLLTEMGGKK